MNEFNEKFHDSIQNDLQLDSPILDIPQDIIFPSELNKHLKDKVQDLLYEKSILKRNLYENELIIKELKESNANLNTKLMKLEGNEFAPVANIARSKIVELSKKLRLKSSEVEALRNKCSKLEQEIAFRQQNNVEKEIVCQPIVEVNENELIVLQDKLNVVTTKLFEEKNQTLKLRNELKFANKLLQYEIGEPFASLQQISSNSNWRGRAQQICDLQHKNNELREKLKQFQDKDSNKLDNAAQRKSLLEKRLDKAIKDCEKYKNEANDFKRKSESIKLKYNNSDMECNVWKNKFTSLTEQMEKDVDIIATLTAQNVANMNNHTELFKKNEKILERTQKELKEVTHELNKNQCRIENLERLLAEKELEIDKLHSRSNYSDNDKKREERFQQKFHAERLRLVELTEVTLQRLNEERGSKASLQNLYQLERHKAARLEAKLARLQLGDVTDSNGSYLSSSSRTIQNDNLLCKLELAEENIKALKTRLDIEKTERQLDFQEFSKIIKNYTMNNNIT